LHSSPSLPRRWSRQLSVFTTFFRLDSLLKRVVQKLAIQANTKTMFVYKPFDSACCCFRSYPPPILNSSGCVAATHSPMFCVFCPQAIRLSDPLAHRLSYIFFVFCYNNFKARQFCAAVALFFSFNLYFNSSFLFLSQCQHYSRSEFSVSTVFSDKSSNDEWIVHKWRHTFFRWRSSQ